MSEEDVEEEGGEGEEEGEEKEEEEEVDDGDAHNILQVDGNATTGSYESSDNESEADSEVDLVNSSSEEEHSNANSETEQDTESDYEMDEEDDGHNTDDEEVIPVMVGNRPVPYAPEYREPIRTTIKRNNKLVDALSVPKMTLYNVRSAWSKWSNIAEDIDIRETDLSFYTEIWQKSENKKHQKAIESIFELKGIKYISTPRPGARRGGGTALACSQNNFVLTKLNISIPAPLEACFGLLKPKNPRGDVKNFLCCSFYSPPHSKSRNKLAEFLVTTIGRLRTEHKGSRVILAGDRNDLNINKAKAISAKLLELNLKNKLE